MEPLSPLAPVDSAAGNLDLPQIHEKLKAAYPSASDRMLRDALAACQAELGEADSGRLIRCVCERITA